MSTCPLANDDFDDEWYTGGAGFPIMIKRLLTLLATTILLMVGTTIAQTTNVTLQVTDADAQTWNNGTWSVILIPSAGITGPFFISGTATPVPNQQQAGFLNGSGSAAITLNSSNLISPGGTQWQFTVCPNATSTCFTQAVSIQGATQSLTLTPPAIRINLTGVPFRVLAYLDLEIANSQPGSIYYNVTAGCAKLFTSSWTCLGTSGATGTVTSVGSGAGLCGGPITGSGSLSICTGGVTNAMLVNSSFTLTCPAPLVCGNASLGATLTATWASNPANLFLATPVSSAGSPSLRAIGSPDIPPINLAASGNGGVTGINPIVTGGTGANAASAALINLFPTATRAGDVIYCTTFAAGACTNWGLLAGNNSGTQYFSETAAGVAAWGPGGSGNLPSTAQGLGVSNITGGTSSFGQTGAWGIDISKLSGADFCAQVVTSMSQTVTTLYAGQGASSVPTNTNIPCASNPIATATFQAGTLQLPDGYILAQTSWLLGAGNNGLAITGTGRGGTQTLGGPSTNTVVTACHNQTGCGGNTITPTNGTAVNSAGAGGTYGSNRAVIALTDPTTNDKYFGVQVSHMTIDAAGIPNLGCLGMFGGQEQTSTDYVTCDSAWYIPDIMAGGWDLVNGQLTVNNQNGFNLHNYEILYPGSSGSLTAVQVTAGGSGATSTCTIPAASSTVRATCVANTTGGVVTSVTITNPGQGYTANQTVTLSGGATATAILNEPGCSGGIMPISATGITTNVATSNKRDGVNPNTYAMATVTLAAPSPVFLVPNMHFQTAGFANGAGGTVFQTGPYDVRSIFGVISQSQFVYLQPAPPGAGADSTGAGAITFVGVELEDLKDASSSDRGFGNGTINGGSSCAVALSNSTSFSLTAVAVTNALTTYTGTITGGASNAFAGQTFNISGYTGGNINDNGTFRAIASTATTLVFQTLPNSQRQVANSAAGTAAVASADNGGIQMAAAEISGGPTVQQADHMEQATNGSSVGDLAATQGYLAIQNNPSNNVLNGLHLSKAFGAAKATTAINQCSAGNTSTTTNIILDDFNSNALLRTSNRCVGLYTVDWSNIVGGVFTNANPNGGADVQNGISVYAGNLDIWNGGTNMFHADLGTGAVKPTLYQSQTNCAVNSASPAACGAAPAGAFVVPTTTTTYTVNTTAATTTSRIFLQPLTFASNLPSSPTCVSPAVTSAYTVSAVSNGTSFTMALPSTTGQTCWQYWIIN